MTATLLDGYRLLHEGALALAEVERNGIRIDLDYCRDKLAWTTEQRARSERRLRSSDLGRAWLSRFGSSTSFASGKQLQAVLYVDLGVKSFKKTASDQDSVDEESLRQTSVDGIPHLLRQRSLKKVSDVLGQFLQHQIGGRIYASYNLHTVTTYRSSSSDPNLQNVPKRDKEQMDICRRALVPSPGNVLLEIDFSGIEVAVAACYHKDPNMLGYLRDPASDMHADAAKKLFFLDRYSLPELREKENFREVLRQAGKNSFIFPQFYGDYYESCAPNIACGWCKLPRIGDWTDADGALFDGTPIGTHIRRQKVCHEFTQGGSLVPIRDASRYYQIQGLVDFTEHVRQVEYWLWNERFPVYNQWRKDWYAKYQRRGRFRMKTGFECGGVVSKNAAVNYPVQGPAFHLLLKTLTLVVNRIRGWISKVVGEIHDSLLIDACPAEVPAIVRMVRRIAAEELPRIWDWIIVPLRVEEAVSKVDGSWADMGDLAKRGYAV